MISTRRLILGLALSALAGGSWWLTYHAARPESVDATAARETPDYVIENFVARAMTEQGIRKYVLSAQQLTHYPADDVAHLIKPVLVQDLPGGVQVTTRADAGIMPGNGREILMQGNVQVSRTAGRGSAGGEITAERLRVELDR